LILGAGFLAVAYGWLLLKVYALSGGSPEFSNFLLALAYPKVLFGLTMAALFLAWALRDWNGRPARRLLLKIIEEHETGQEGKCSEQDGAANRSQPVRPGANRTPPAAGPGG
jgi:hypothetical protein